MKFLADMGLARSTVAFLRSQGHDAVHLSEQGLQRLEDDEIVEKALNERGIRVRPFRARWDKRLDNPSTSWRAKAGWKSASMPTPPAGWGFPSPTTNCPSPSPRVRSKVCWRPPGTTRAIWPSLRRAQCRPAPHLRCADPGARGGPRDGQADPFAPFRLLDHVPSASSTRLRERVYGSSQMPVF
ncbi:MAG: DUF5615 family PIN-like protein [Anaerolineae bacterium]